MSALPGLYLHVPFCISKCPYCDFFSVTSNDRAEEMVQAMLIEMEHRAQAMEPFDTIYIGGGTPSSIHPDLLNTLLAAGKKHLVHVQESKFAPEITVELNPADVDDVLLKTLSDSGVNRISLGVQSFSDDNLITLGRRHDSHQALVAIDSIRSHGFSDMGIDLIYGLPGCPVEVWRDDLKKATALRPEHLSCYALTISPDTPFGRDKSLGARRFPTDGIIADLFIETSDIIRSAGYIHYEVSNFALRTDTMSRHNSKYWQRIAYLGIGPSAHSFDTDRRWWNICDVDSYCDEVSRTGIGQMGEEKISYQQAYTETVALGMRTSSGVTVDLLASHGVEYKRLQKLSELGLVEITEGRVVPTTKGYLMADGIAAQLS